MTVAFDAFDSGAGGTGNLEWTHTPVGTPRGVLVFVLDAAATSDNVTGVTYGGETMTEVDLSPHIASIGADDVALHCFFLGSSVPTGEQTVSVSASGTNKQGQSITLTAAADTTVQDTTVFTLEGSGDLTGTLSLGGNDCFCAEALGTELPGTAGIAPLTGWTDQSETDFGAQVCGVYTYDTVASDDVTFGANHGGDGTRDLAALGVAVTESGAAPADAVGSGLTTGLKLERRRLVG